jgi:hypothetical protein
MAAEAQRQRRFVQDVLQRRWWTLGAPELSRRMPAPFPPSAYFKRVVLDGHPSTPLNRQRVGAYSLSEVDDPRELRRLRAVLPTQFERGPYTYTFRSAKRVQNETLQSLFEACAPDSHYVLGFHGTGDGNDSLVSIMAFGFAPQLCETGIFGPGTYFARDLIPALVYYGQYDGRASTVSILMAACALGLTRRFEWVPDDLRIPDGYGAFEIGTGGLDDVLVVQDYRLVYPAYILTYAFAPI